MKNQQEIFARKFPLSWTLTPALSHLMGEGEVVPAPEGQRPSGSFKLLRTGISALRVLGVLAIAVCFCAPALRAQSTNSDAGPNYDSFSIISQRNIFNPNRRRFEPWRPPQQQQRVDEFTLVGTMSYAKGKFAFFDGSRSDYRKVLEPGASIAGYTVKDVTPKTVTLASNGKEVEMSVGSQMRNEGPNDWKLSTQRDAPPSTDSNADSHAAFTPPAGTSAAETDILKAMAERRKQEDENSK